MRTVYLIQSVEYPEQTYIGTAPDFNRRLKQHNAGRSPHTIKYAPWEFVEVIQFADKRKVNAFERYLKTGSGRTFAKKHFW